MKNLGKTLIAAVCLAAAAGTATAQVQDIYRIVFVDMERVFAEYYKTKRADTRLKEQAEEYNEERNERVTDLRDVEEQFNAARTEAQDQTLSEEARDRKRSEAEELLAKLRGNEQEIRKFEEARRTQLEEQGRRMRKRIVDEISRVLQRFAKERDLFAVIDSSGPSLNQVPVMLYTETKADITDEILALLNKGVADEETLDEEEEEEVEEEEEMLEEDEETADDKASESGEEE